VTGALPYDMNGTDRQGNARGGRGRG
jgi:hypothetical protein